MEVVLGILEIRNLRLLSRFPSLLNSAKSFDLSISQKLNSDFSNSDLIDSLRSEKSFDSLESLNQSDQLFENYSFDFYFLLPPTQVSSCVTLDFLWFKYSADGKTDSERFFKSVRSWCLTVLFQNHSFFYNSQHCCFELLAEWIQCFEIAATLMEFDDGQSYEIVVDSFGWSV